MQSPLPANTHIHEESFKAWPSCSGCRSLALACCLQRAHLDAGLSSSSGNEARGGARHLLTEIRTAAKLVPGPRLSSRWRPVKTVATGVHCPCGADHSQIGQDQ